ncbi:major facilitator superfamily domain-containing protein [Chaetomidium leptoderma]|uniref:Major facilitator superfamily domain-containing protein n=1 Tax=Chaetomidium leptoderma TaxID=669021 RepID=A0AAN6ZVK3_9PEZI|nr:major facilitator superfamily domain-containing protein [Chaetomidium leptoderma]
MGAIVTQVREMYPSEDQVRVANLLTFPTLFMGIGNLLAMPLCVAIGRRPVFLMSLVVLVASGIWCACSSSLSSHIAARNTLSMAAGQSEALVAFMVQEMHFLHQRGRAATWNAAIQGAGTGAMFVANTYLVPAWGVRWWYGVITIINGVLLLAAFFLVPETLYDRILEDEENEARNPGDGAKVARVTTTTNHTLDPDRYGGRTWRHDLKIFHFALRWSETWIFYKVAGQSFLIPSIVWLLLLNGAFRGVYVFQSSTFAPVLLRPPYLFKFEFLGFVQLEIVVANLIALPVIGYGSDWNIKLMSRMNKGVCHPEYRLLSVILPSIIAVVSCVIYGQTAQHPEKWSWAGIVIPYAAGFLAFLGANTVAITYVVDSWPAEAGPMLLVVAAGRGFISFGLSYAMVPWVEENGYDGSMRDLAIVCGVFALLGIPCYFFGRKMRLWSQKRLYPSLV